MAHGRLSDVSRARAFFSHHAPRAALLAPALGLAVASVIAACTPRPAPVVTPVAAPSASASSAEPSAGWERGKWGRFHSMRHDVFVSLPDGRTWAIDDHKSEWLSAAHAPSSSVFRLRMTHEDKAQSHAKCEAAARAREPGLPREDQGRVIASPTDLVPGWDTQATALIIPKEAGALEGHVLVFAANVRRCLLVHFATRSAGPDAEAVLGARLGDATDIVRRLTIEDERLGPGRESLPGK